ncbi:RNA polymerase subunit sigma [Paenibacillus agricola]|uniref:RNA polymerase subunit sigma n=1 Tax=Paenibacillus agricola TaxID=2716264 RepID=A0ABX0J2G9_9BACL|nr:RNA polymerase subunit sigma [Paenibacillus agricola]NHN29314.1 RNA polymerase subunit sigma [Paenibacillus agricola]
MKKKISLSGIILLLLAGIAALTGCLNSPTQVIEPQSQSALPGYDFKLSPQEQEVYSRFQKDLNEQHLKELEPISIAKVYIQASLDNKKEVQYALYTDRSGHVLWTKEESEKFTETGDRVQNKQQTLKLFNNIEKGSFIQTSDFEGYIEFVPRPEVQGAEGKSGFQMIKDEDGIWNVAFQPIQ